jgi:hypothetical protein
MKHQLTYGQLVTIEKDMQHIQQNHPAISMLLHASIALFYQQASNHLTIIAAGMDLIKEKFVEKNADGKFLVHKKEDGSLVWKFKPTYTDFNSAAILTGKKLEERFEQQLQQFLESKTVTIHF